MDVIVGETSGLPVATSTLVDAAVAAPQPEIPAPGRIGRDARARNLVRGPDALESRPLVLQAPQDSLGREVQSVRAEIGKHESFGHAIRGRERRREVLSGLDVEGMDPAVIGPDV